MNSTWTFKDGLGMERVLIIDDDPHVRHAVRQALLREGFDVLEAVEGYEGLAKALTESPATVLLELVLPRMSGLEVCRQLRDSMTTQHLPVIVLTRRERVEDKLRAMEAGADDYLVKPCDVREVCARIQNLLERSKRDRGASPLTGLPGNAVLDQELARRVREPGRLAAIHFDLNNFKPYNDYYSYQRGDQVLKLTAQLITEAARAHGDRETLVAHLGGDDFFVVTTPERAEAIANRALRSFDALVPLLYDEVDQRVGYITAVNRSGKVENFPLMTLAACIATNESPHITHPGQIAQTLAELKSVAKRAGRSTYVRDRRLEPPPSSRAPRRDSPLGTGILRPPGENEGPTVGRTASTNPSGNPEASRR
ncbi:MAG: GGDEF domain-containing response regulator [Candidatus Zipacnadales bacterium]